MASPQEAKIKIPARSSASKVERALKKAARDGAWHIIILDMGMTSAEQTARAYNVPGGSWEFGYTHDHHSDGSGELVSTLWVRWIG